MDMVVFRRHHPGVGGAYHQLLFECAGALMHIKANGASLDAPPARGAILVELPDILDREHARLNNLVGFIVI